MDLNKKEDLTKKLILQTAFHWFSLSSLMDFSVDGISDKTWTLILFKFATAEAADWKFLLLISLFITLREKYED